MIHLEYITILSMVWFPWLKSLTFPESFVTTIPEWKVLKIHISQELKGWCTHLVLLEPPTTKPASSFGVFFPYSRLLKFIDSLFECQLRICLCHTSYFGEYLFSAFCCTTGCPGDPSLPRCSLWKSQRKTVQPERVKRESRAFRLSLSMNLLDNHAWYLVIYS